MKNLLIPLSLLIALSCVESTNQDFLIEIPSKQLSFPSGSVEASISYLLNSGDLFCPSLKLKATQKDEPLSVAIKWELYDDKGRLFASLLSDKFKAQKGLFQSGEQTFEVRKHVPETFLLRVKSVEARVIEARFGRGDLFGGG